MSEEKKMVTSRLVFAWGCLLLIMSQSAMAATGVNIRVEILGPPPCIINGDSTLNVPFGDVMTTRIDGGEYRLEVPYTVVCERQPSNAMTITLQGTGADFDGTSLSTSNSELGVKLLMGGQAWPLNNALKFTYPNLPKMEAVLVKNPNSALSAGAFSAAATIVVALQ